MRELQNERERSLVKGLREEAYELNGISNYRVLLPSGFEAAHNFGFLPKAKETVLPVSSSAFCILTAVYVSHGRESIQNAHQE